MKAYVRTRTADKPWTFMNSTSCKLFTVWWSYVLQVISFFFRFVLIHSFCFVQLFDLNYFNSKFNRNGWSDRVVGDPKWKNTFSDLTNPWKFRNVFHNLIDWFSNKIDEILFFSSNKWNIRSQTKNKNCTQFPLK